MTSGEYLCVFISSILSKEGASEKTGAVQSAIDYEQYFDISPDGTITEDEFTRSMRAEENTVEQANWIGCTGLGEDVERELPRYLRLEFGESILDDDSLKAADMIYLGIFALDKKNLEEQFSPDAHSVHVWQLPGYDEDDPYYGYIEIWKDGTTCFGMGDYLPQKKL